MSVDLLSSSKTQRRNRSNFQILSLSKAIVFLLLNNSIVYMRLLNNSSTLLPKLIQTALTPDLSCFGSPVLQPLTSPGPLTPRAIRHISTPSTHGAADPIRS